MRNAHGLLVGLKRAACSYSSAKDRSRILGDSYSVHRCVQQKHIQLEDELRLETRIHKVGHQIASLSSRFVSSKCPVTRITMLSFLRTTTPRTSSAHLNPVFYEDGRSHQRFRDHSSPYMVTITSEPNSVEHGNSMFHPPMHFHMYQTEDFLIDEGSARFGKFNAARIQIS